MPLRWRSCFNNSLEALYAGEDDDNKCSTLEKAKEPHAVEIHIRFESREVVLQNISFRVAVFECLRKFLRQVPSLDIREDLFILNGSDEFVVMR